MHKEKPAESKLVGGGYESEHIRWSSIPGRSVVGEFDIDFLGRFFLSMVMCSQLAKLGFRDMVG